MPSHNKSEIKTRIIEIKSKYFNNNIIFNLN